MFYRIFGGKGSGKTKYIYDRLSECVKNRKKAFLLVPEQSGAKTEKEVIDILGGQSNLYVEVINFKRLCNRVFRQLGGLTSAHLDDGARKMLMMLALSNIKPYLKEYSASAENADFAEKALSMTDELKKFKISASSLEKTAELLKLNNQDEQLSLKLCDLALICEAYESRISEIPGAVSDIYEKLCEKLREDDFFGGCDVFFDAFYGFTAEEYEIISLIAESADNTYITFTCRRDDADEVYVRSRKSAKMCQKIAEKAGCTLSDVYLDKNFRHKENSSLCVFEKEFSSLSLSKKDLPETQDESIKVFKCADIYDEARFAVSTVLSFVRKGACFSDIAICVKNTKDYSGVLDTAFEKAGIPLGIDEPETLAESALFELCVSAIESAVNFRNTSVLRYVKSGLSGLDEHEADLFESYVKTWDISPSLMKRDEDFTMNPDGYVDSPADKEALCVINSARKKVFVCIDSLSKNLKECKTLKDFATALYNLLQDIRRVSEKEDFDDLNGGRSISLLYECLDSLVLCAPDEKMTLAVFLSIFKGCAKDYNTGHIPELAKQVQLSGVDLVRCENKKHVIILGVNSGVFPSSCRSASLISDSERRILKREGIDISEDARELVFDELFLAYCAIASASETCYLSYQASDLNSAVLFPSSVISAVQGITGCKTVVFDACNFDENYPGDELLFEELSVLENGERKNTLIKYFSSIPEYAQRLSSLSSEYNQADYLKESTLAELYGNSLLTSYSRLEKMAGCPFSHFCTYVLRLKPEQAASLGPAQAGSVMHKILEELVPILCTKENGAYPDEDRAKELVQELLCRHLSRIAHTDVENLPKRFVYLYNRLSKLLFEISVNIVRELRVSRFVPSGFEVNISSDADVKPVPIDMGDGRTLYITGQIDRVDTYEKDGITYVRIIDYKTGKKTFKLADIRCGFNLQMLLYLSAVTSPKNTAFGEKTVPAGVLYSNVVSSANSVTAGKDDLKAAAERTTGPVSSGIFIDDDEILMAMDPTENSIYLPIGRKNGAASKKDAVTTLEEMGNLLSFATETASALAKEMMNGNKAISPFDGKSAGVDIDPCKHCDMSSVCMGKPIGKGDETEY